MSEDEVDVWACVCGWVYDCVVGVQACFNYMSIYVLTFTLFNILRSNICTWSL